MLSALEKASSAPAIGGGRVTAVVAAFLPGAHVVKAEKAPAQKQKKKGAEEQKANGDII